ncbi:hypothetical protein [Maridesulfovibrio frigidus]|uniref:hypothetical protein n=1 Tax=Maridesulfovibrio frigidus TaxID=340956 RepID=UPI0004E0B594|nr:hypothetical protein [Maridesulfovibrio frigidus]
MSSLKPVEKRLFEEIFEMDSGYVLDFSNASFADFFMSTLLIDIYAQKYAFIGESKAKRLKGFWEIEPDTTVAKCLEELLEYCNLSASLNRKVIPEDLSKKAMEIIGRLSGRKPQKVSTEDEFLNREYKNISLGHIDLEGPLVPILQARLIEAGHCLEKAPLATIFLCGSILEGVLLGVANKNPKAFNQARSTPRKDEKPKQFHDWSLAQFIDVAHELGFLGEDIKKFGHSLRDFRNYIHPYSQMHSGFSPDIHTAKICLQVLKAALVRLGASDN